MNKQNIYQKLAYVFGVVTLVGAIYSLIRPQLSSPSFVLVPMMIFLILLSLSEKKSYQGLTKSLRSLSRLDIFSIVSSLALIIFSAYIIIGSAKLSPLHLGILIILFLCSVISTVLTKLKTNSKKEK